MKYVLTIKDELDINKNADAFILGNINYATRLITSFSLDEIKKLVNKIHNINKLAFINVNKIFHNPMLEGLTSFLVFLKEIEVDGIIFSDMGVYNIAKKMSIENKLIYNPDTLITNEFDFNYGKVLGIKGCFISPFISIENIKIITKCKELECFYIGFGHLNIFNSKRHLIKSYMEHKKIKLDLNKKYKLKEELRDDLYPYYEDINGTYMFTPYISNALNFDLQGIDFMVLDFILIEDKIALFDQIIDGKIDFETSTGFLNKEIVYKKVK